MFFRKGAECVLICRSESLWKLIIRHCPVLLHCISAILHSDKDETHDVWLGRIAQIRQRANGEVWVKTLWYFSGSDAEAHMKSLQVHSYII